MASAIVSQHGLVIGTRECATEKSPTSEWHYYISSASLTAEELLTHARLEWGVEAMHWLLDVHFAEDKTRVWDMNIQKTLNICQWKKQ